MTRRTLPQRRAATTTTMRWRGTRFEVSFGRFEDGAPAEAFINATKPGSEVQVLASDAAVLLSLALQHGVPLETIRHAMAREERGGADGIGRPQSLIGAVVDAIANEVT